jgi:HEAT repeat protein
MRSAPWSRCGGSAATISLPRPGRSAAVPLSCRSCGRISLVRASILKVMHEHRGSDTAIGDALVARLVNLEPIKPEHWPAARAEAHKALNQHAHTVVSDPAGPAWLTTLATHPNSLVRAIAVRALGSGHDPAHQPILVQALSDPAANVVHAALEGLTAQSSDEVFDLLVTLLNETDPDRAWTSRYAAQRIAETSDPRRLDVLADALGQVHLNAFHDITHALSRAGDLRVAPVLIEHLRHRRPGRFAAAEVLGNLRVAEATGPLIDVLRESDGPQSLPVMQALGKLEALDAAPAIVPLLDHSSSYVRDGALLALNRIGGPLATRAALKATDDVHPVVRTRAFRVLARHGDHRALGRLARPHRPHRPGSPGRRLGRTHLDAGAAEHRRAACPQACRTNPRPHRHAALPAQPRSRPARPPRHRLDHRPTSRPGLHMDADQRAQRRGRVGPIPRRRSTRADHPREDAPAADRGTTRPQATRPGQRRDRSGPNRP